MLHPPASYVQRIAKQAESELERMVGSIIVVFSPEIDSSHMLALAVRLARGERSELLAIYVVEVPYTLPRDAEMPSEERAALDALFDHGRPARVHLLVLIDRGHRELPIEAQFVGRTVQTTENEIIEVKFQEIDETEKVLLVEKIAEENA